MKKLTSTFLLFALFSYTSAHAERAGHDELKHFLDCEVKAKSSDRQSDCTPPSAPQRKPTQAQKPKIKMEELKADKAPVEEFGHPHFLHAQPRGGGTPR